MHCSPIGSVTALLALALAGCMRGGDSGEAAAAPRDVTEAHAATPKTIAVSNSFFSAVMREVTDEPLPLFPLAEPGMCPGHFDLRPSQVRQAMDCRMVIRFDFQQSLDRRFALEGRPPKTVEIKVPGGLCEPASYLNACRDVADALVAEGIVARDVADARLAALAERLDALDRWAGQQMETAGLVNASVLASRHQAAFCSHLGLKVAATFPSADSALPSELEQAVQEGRATVIRLVIANLPEGRQAADALADRFGARVVVFGNFPDGKGTDSFDRLVRGNVAALVEAAKP